MELIPSIDLLDGAVVRLHQGRYDRVTTFFADPLEPAARFVAEGATRLHVVDLDGARDGRPGNTAAIARLVAQLPLAVQVGGGVRSLETARAWLDAGAARVVMGTAAIREPAIVEAICRHRPAAVVVAVDARDGLVAVDGWQVATDSRVEDVARRFDQLGVGAFLYTNIARDGTADGPDVEGTLALQATVEATVIASGGIGTLAHIGALARAGARAAVCGRALYTGVFSYADGRALATDEA